MTTSRGLRPWRRCEDVHHRRAGHRLRHGCGRAVWGDLLDLDDTMRMLDSMKEKIRVCHMGTPLIDVYLI